MGMFKQVGDLLMAASRAHAKWEIEMATTILHSRKRLFVLGLLLVPIIIGGIAFADEVASALPSVLGGKNAYTPSYYSNQIFFASMLVGVVAGLITGCIGAGGGFVIAPALMSAGVKGILAVGTDLFHIFAKAIMGSVLHKKLGNISVSLAMVFLIGSLGGATAGGIINRTLYEINPVLSDAFITTVYSLMLGLLGFVALGDFLRTRKAAGGGGDAHGGAMGEDIPSLGQKLQAIKIPPMVTFDQGVTPGGRQISAIFVVLSGALVGFLAAIMGVGGGFVTFPIFVYVLGVSSMTTVGTDIFQIIFTAGYSALGQYAIYGFIFYTLAMGMLLGSLFGIQVGALVTKLVPGIYIRAFYALTVLGGFINRICALPKKLASLGYISLSKEAGTVLEQIGVYGLFLILGVFSLWIFWTFFSKIHILKGKGVAA